MKHALALLALLLLIGCRDERPPAPTPEESQQLDEAEAMLNAEAPKQEGPAPGGTDPSNRSDEQ